MVPSGHLNLRSQIYQLETTSCGIILNAGNSETLVYKLQSIVENSLWLYALLTDRNDSFNMGHFFWQVFYTEIAGGEKIYQRFFNKFVKNHTAYYNCNKYSN
jgi:hypothetical protein